MSWRKLSWKETILIAVIAVPLAVGSHFSVISWVVILLGRLAAYAADKPGVQLLVAGLTVGFGLVLWAYKQRQQFAFGLTEMAAAIWLAVFACKAATPTQAGFSLLTAVYIVVRGWENITAGHEKEVAREKKVDAIWARMIAVLRVHPHLVTEAMVDRMPKGHKQELTEIRISAPVRIAPVADAAADSEALAELEALAAELAALPTR